MRAVHHGSVAEGPEDFPHGVGGAGRSVQGE